MNQRVQHLIKQCIKYEKTNYTFRTRLCIVFRHWLAGILEDEQKKEFFARALKQTIAMYNEDPANIQLLLLIIQLYTDLENYEEASALMKALDAYKSYFKNEKPQIYGVLLYLRIRIDYFGDHHRGVNSLFKQLKNIGDETKENSYMLLCIGIIYKDVYEDGNQALEFLYKAYKRGCRSPVLFIYVLRIISKADTFHSMNDMTARAIQWGTTYGKVMENLAQKLGQWIVQNGHAGVIWRNTIEVLYDKWPTKELLHGLTILYVNQKNMSTKALHLYKQCWEQQIYIKDLDVLYMWAAYEQKVEEIPLGILQNAILSTQLQEPLQCFAYHVLFSSERYKMLQSTCYDKMLSFAAQALQKKRKGKYYVTIYQKLLEKTPQDPKLIEIIFEQLFMYELRIKSSHIRYIWSIESEKQRMEAYAVTDSSMFIKASSPEFQLYCVGARQKTFYQKKYIGIEKLVGHIDGRLLKKFYDMGFRNVELLISLSRYYLEMDFLPAEAEPIVKHCMEYSEISTRFRKQISAALGSFYVEDGRITEAIGYFNAVDSTELQEEQYIKAIGAFIAAQETMKAIQWTSKRKELLPDKLLYQIVKIARDQKIDHPMLPQLACELLQKGWYDGALLSYVMERYEGSLTEWYLLKDQMQLYGKPTRWIDEKILERGIQINRFDSGLQEAFLEVYTTEPMHALVRRFIDYCVYEVVFKGSMVEYSTVQCLENFLKSHPNEHFVAYALLHIYLRQSIQTEHGKEVIQNALDQMEQNQVLFPIVKQHQDKFLHSSYIQKNIPFVHYDHPKHTCALYYRIVPENEYVKKEMKYFGLGMHIVNLSLFYHETLQYFFEVIDEGGTTRRTEEKEITYSFLRVVEEPQELYDILNNGRIYEQMVDFDQLDVLLQQKTYGEMQMLTKGYII